jgi:hypothetical protein
MIRIECNEPAESPEEVVSRTPLLGVAISVLSFGALIALLGWLAVTSWNELTLAPRLLSGAVMCALALVGIDQLQRVYSFRRDYVAVRYLGLWRRSDLPGSIDFMRYPGGDLVIMDANGGPYSFKVSRGWTKHGTLQSSLSRFYASCGRYCRNVGNQGG